MTAPALRLARLVLRDFRNIASADLRPHPRLTVLEGDNGQGKSNVLEAVCLVGWQRSFRGARPEEMIRAGEARARVEAHLEAPPDPDHEVVVELRPGGKNIRLDGKRCAADRYFGLVQVVLFHPGELALVQGGPSERRALLDRVLYQTTPWYPAVHRDFRLALQSRNRLLRDEAAPDVVQAFDRPLAEAAVRIIEARERLVGELGPRVVDSFVDVSGGRRGLEVRYRPRTVAATVEEMLGALRDAWPRDRARTVTSAGPQGDDVELSMGGRTARSFASQGQQRALVLAIKAAELDVIERRSGRVPLLLLDDVSSELDPLRSRALFERVGRGGGQVIVTTTRASILPRGSDRLELRVRDGIVSH